MRINTGLIGIIAILIAINDYNIISVLVFVQVMLSAGIGVPLAAALFGFKVKNRDFYFCVAGSIITYIIASTYYGALNYMTSFFTLFTGLISFIISCIQHNRIIDMVFINIKKKNNEEINTKKLKCKKSLPKILNYMDKSMSNSQPNYIMFGIFSAVNYIVPYFMWPQNIQSHYELMLFMRIFAGLLCIGLLLKEYWKIKYKKYFSSYWFFTLLYTLTVMPTVMFLVNNKLFEWLLNISLGIFILSMLVEWRMFLILLVKGVLIGVTIAVKLLHTEIIISNNSNIFMGIYLVVFTIIVGLTFSRKREVSINERVNHLSVLGGTIAHEMRTPLTTINANLEILREKISNKKDKEAVDRMFMTTQRAYNVINMLLYNLKNEMKIKTTKDSIKELVRTAIENFCMTEKEKEWVNIEYGKEDALVDMDKLYAEYVIFNLLKNALYQRKKHKKGYIKISAENNAIIIEDNIIGIDSDKIKEIFNKEYTGEHHGTGLGLAFCKLAMEKMGGSIKCESSYLQYTKFTLLFY